MYKFRNRNEARTCVKGLIIDEEVYNNKRGRDAIKAVSAKTGLSLFQVKKLNKEKRTIPQKVWWR